MGIERPLYTNCGVETDIVRLEVSKYSYKPDSTMEVHYSLNTNEYFLIITQCLEDADRVYQNRIDVKIEWSISQYLSPDFRNVADAVRQAICEAIDAFEKHESQEWLRYNGTRIFNPH